MEISEAIEERRSIRKYTDRHVEKAKIEGIIDSARWAPSADNIQGYRFIIVTSSKLKQRIVDLGGAIFIKDSPVGILVCYDNRTDNVEYSDYIQSASAAIQNMLLTAHSLGLGSCWVCQLPTRSQLRKLLKIPGVFDPIAYITLGYPAHQRKVMERKYSVREIVSENRFNFPINKRNVKAKTFLRKIYFRMPLFLKKLTRGSVEKRFVKKFR